MTPTTLIRNIRLPDHVSSSGVVHWRAFMPDEADKGQGLSCALAGASVSTDADLDDYIAWSSSGIAPDRIGCCFVEQSEVLEARMQVVPAPLDQSLFGSIHHLIQDSEQDDLCPPRDKLKVLANLSNAYGDARRPHRATA